MKFTKPVAEIPIKTTALNDLVLKTAPIAAHSSAVQRHFLEPIAQQ
jgi:hypothetical protein